MNHESPEILESDNDENDLYQVENMSLDETTGKLTDNSAQLIKKSISD